MCDKTASDPVTLAKLITSVILFVKPYSRKQTGHLMDDGGNLEPEEVGRPCISQGKTAAK